jgi:hypothetical protein
VPFPQGLLQRRVQLARVDVALGQIPVHEGGIHLHHLLHQCAVGVGDRREVGLAAGREEAVGHAPCAVGGQVQRQAFAPEDFAQLRKQRGQVDADSVDLVDDDQPREAPLACGRHQALGHQLDAVLGVDDDHRGVGGFQGRQGLADEVGRARRVDGMHADTAVGEVREARLQRMPEAPFQRVVVADRAAPLDAARLGQGAGMGQQGVQQQGLASGRRADQRDRADRAHS